nr:uncharacterized protein LOC111752327 [Loxodonta africana]
MSPPPPPRRVAGPLRLPWLRFAPGEPTVRGGGTLRRLTRPSDARTRRSGTPRHRGPGTAGGPALGWGRLGVGRGRARLLWARPALHRTALGYALSRMGSLGNPRILTSGKPDFPPEGLNLTVHKCVSPRPRRARNTISQSC